MANTKRRQIMCAVAAMLLLPVFAAEDVTASITMEPNSKDCSQAFLSAIESIKQARVGTIVLKPGEYHFAAGTAKEMRFYISNHDQSPSHPVNLPLVGVTNLTIRGNGAKLIFHGATLGAAIIDSKNVRLENLSMDWSRPFLTEMTITGFEDGRTLGRINGALFPYEIENGRLVACGEGWRSPVGGCMLFDGATHHIVEKSADIPYFGAVIKRADGVLSCEYDFRKVGVGAKIGDVVCLRPHKRPYPAVVVYHAQNTDLEDVVIHTAWGMGLIAQACENVIWRGTGRAESMRSGVFAPINSGRVTTLHADASHFANVKGKVVVENCSFEAMMDDAINVHNTCLAIIKKEGAHRIRCRYMHEQAIGYGVFDVGDKLRFIKGKTLENDTVTQVTAVEVHDAREITLTLSDAIPDRLGEGDAVENADYQPSVVFRGNIVRNNRARGALFTTPRSICCEDNLFDNVAGSAILFAGDAQGWYESGACEDVVIRRNRFRNCLTSVFQFCNGVISSFPTVRKIDQQKVPYHRNITITENVFETFDVPLLYARSTEKLVFKDNVISRNCDHQGWNKGLFVTEKCRDLILEPPSERLETGLPPSGAVSRPEDNFNAGWQFSKNGRDWQVVDLPHDAAIASDFDPKKYTTGCGALPYYGRVEYRKTLQVSESEVQSLRNGDAAWRLEFDGVMSHCRILLNGAELYSRPNGYASFAVVVSDRMKSGGNLLEVIVDAPKDSSRWYPGLGLYRDVRLVKRGADCVVPGSVAIVAKNISARSAEVEVAWSQARSGHHVRRFTVEHPRLWSPETPHLYTVEVGDEIYRYGIRTLRYSPDEGFFLNGKHRQMRGVCMHHDLGVFGAAFVKDAARRQLSILKEMGCDAIRTSHNLPAPGLLELCDEMGIMVMDEAFDEWKAPKVRHGVAEVWETWGRREILDLVRRDRNHPCVVMWSAGNELVEDEPGRNLAQQGAAIARELTAIFHAHDPEGRLVTAGHWRDNTITNGIGAATDVFGANYLPKRYAEFKGRQGVIGTETCSTVSTRGTFFLPVDGKYAVTNQVSDYGLCPMHPNDYPPDDEFAAQDANPHVYGEFVWTGFDYLGEPDPWRGTSRSSFFGIFDLCGFPKARYWQYRSQWRPDVPTAKVLPDWNRKPGECMPVHVLTSGDEAELFLNGRSLGRRSKNGGYRIVWENVAFEPGELKAVVWKAGKLWAEDRSVTAGAFARFKTSDEVYGDYLFRTFTAVDSEGRFVSNAARPVDYGVPDGYAVYGTCNGDPSDLNSLRSSTVVSFSGKALVVFKRKK